MLLRSAGARCACSGAGHHPEGVPPGRLDTVLSGAGWSRQHWCPCSGLQVSSTPLLPQVCEPRAPDPRVLVSVGVCVACNVLTVVPLHSPGGPRCHKGDA